MFLNISVERNLEKINTGEIMSDFGKIGFNTPEVKVETTKSAEQTPKAPEEQTETKETLTQVHSGHFIPGQSQVGVDNLAHDMKVFMEHPELVETSNDLYDKVYQDFLDEGYSEADAAGKAATIQSAFVNELLK